MEKLYHRQSAQQLSFRKEKEDRIIKIITSVIFFILFSLFVFWMARTWVAIPIVYKSMSQNTIVRVTKANGDILPLSPLPEKYEIIHIK